MISKTIGYNGVHNIFRHTHLYPCVIIYPLTQTQLDLLVARIETPPGPLRSSLETSQTSQTSQSLRHQNFHHILSSKTHWNVKASRLWNTNLPNHQHFRICGLSKFFDPSDVRPGCRGFGFAASPRLVSPLRRMCTPKLPRPDTCARLLLLGWWRGISDVPDKDNDDDGGDDGDNDDEEMRRWGLAKWAKWGWG